MLPPSLQRRPLRDSLVLSDPQGWKIWMKNMPPVNAVFRTVKPKRKKRASVPFLTNFVFDGRADPRENEKFGSDRGFQHEKEACAAP